jgi:hypothetical protein
MPSRVLITFSGADYDRTTKRIVEDGPRFGADAVLVYDDRWLEEHDFRQVNRHLWDHHHKRGFGWYAWKPLLLLDALGRVDDRAVVLFIDADTVPIADMGPIFETAAKDGAMFFAAQGHNNRQWCKRDCLIVMDQDEPKYVDAQAGVARFIAIQRGPWKPLQLLMEWLAYCVNIRATTFDPSVIAPERPGFKEHRTEQAILTNLAHKYGYRLHREADQHGQWSDDDKALYGQIFESVNYENQSKYNAAKGSPYRNV